ncbi:MAG: HDOD domain-containing protein [Phycisphaerales bacterium]|nr:MAG: HDOD domain-containing protein [Phycisphaerales bacterium]
MNQDALDKILSCSSLPSLPAVAVQVIELTSDPSVKLEDLARTIENDQGLAAKILRTVNSSFFGLRRRCATIDRALVMLGLNPVKNLALGFSLVSAMKPPASEVFDQIAYWRRGLYTAVGARCFAEEIRLDEPDEAFLAGLLQDIGVMAMLIALGDEYLDVLANTEGDHRRLVREELDTLEVQHPDIGAMLAKRWRLPDQLVIPVKYHERPTAAPAEQAKLVRCVALGNLVHDVLTDEQPAAALRRLYQKAQSWLGLNTDAVDGIMTEVGKHIGEVAKLFNLDTGSYRDSDEVLAEAQRQMVSINRGGVDSIPLGLNELLAGKTDTDPMTGLLSRTCFDEVMQRALAVVREDSETVVLVEFAIDGLGPLQATLGQEAVDEAVVGAAIMLRKHFEPAGGICCRLSKSLFGVIVLGSTEGEAERIAGDLCADAEAQAWAGGLSVATGMASQSPEGASAARSEDVVAKAARALQAARIVARSAA